VRRTRSRALAAALLVAATALGGCGDGGGGSATKSTAAAQKPPPTGATTATAPSGTTTAPAAGNPAQPGRPHAPATGGNGGSEPARSEIEIVAGRSGVSPRRFAVAPFVAVAVTLRSADGAAHTARLGGHTLSAAGGRSSARVTLPGLPPGKAYTTKVDGTKQVTILSSSEPGP
jgi:hypothetical protein